MALPQVVIIGGGVAGLTAAHELKERGFQVTVHERQADRAGGAAPVLGGKARSFSVRALDAYGWNSPNDGSKIVGHPAEHGFRFFPGFYQHVIDTLSRIPAGAGKNVIDNIINVDHAAYAQEGQPLFQFPTGRPKTLWEFFESLKRMLIDNPSLGLEPGETAFAIERIVNAMTMCDERRERELDKVSWWDYMKADDKSDAYRKVIINGLTQNFVAMDARMSSTKSVISILARMLNDLTAHGRTVDRILNGPTSEVWIDPWKKYLTTGPGDPGGKPGQLAVTFNREEVDSLTFDAATGEITGVKPAGQAAIAYPSGTQFILAVPVEVATRILDNTAVQTPEIFEHAPTLKTIKELKVNWMVGLVYYLKRDVQTCPGHIVYLNSTWALTSISQNQFWSERTRAKIVREALARKVEREIEEEERRLNRQMTPQEKKAFRDGKAQALEGERRNAINRAEQAKGRRLTRKEELAVEADVISGHLEVQGYISTIISDWDTPGIKIWKRPAREAGNSKRIADETHAQIRAHLAGIPPEHATMGDWGLLDGERHLDDDPDDPTDSNIIVGYCLDPAITFKQEFLALMPANAFVNLLRNWRDLPTIIALRRRFEELRDQPFAQVDELMNFHQQITDAPEADRPRLWEQAFRLVLGDEVSRERWVGPVLNWLFRSQEGATLQTLFLALARPDRSQRVQASFINWVHGLGAKLDELLRTVTLNQEPLFINTAGSWSNRPTAVTGIENLFLASDYVKTDTDLATMEGANEAARRAVNGILDAIDSKRARCKTFKFEEPAALAPFRVIDKVRFDLGLAHPSLEWFLSFGVRVEAAARKWMRR